MIQLLVSTLQIMSSVGISGGNWLAQACRLIANLQCERVESDPIFSAQASHGWTHGYFLTSFIIYFSRLIHTILEKHGAMVVVP